MLRKCLKWIHVTKRQGTNKTYGPALCQAPCKGLLQCVPHKHDVSGLPPGNRSAESPRSQGGVDDRHGIGAEVWLTLLPPLRSLPQPQALLPRTPPSLPETEPRGGRRTTLGLPSLHSTLLPRLLLSSERLLAFAGLILHRERGLPSLITCSRKPSRTSPSVAASVDPPHLAGVPGTDTLWTPPAVRDQVTLFGGVVRPAPQTQFTKKLLEGHLGYRLVVPRPAPPRSAPTPAQIPTLKP